MRIFTVLVMAALLAVVLIGCVEPRTAYCDTCIGPYDITLTSHREAVFGHPYSRK